MLYCHFISPLKCVIIMKPNVNPVTLYTKKERTRKANTLCKTKLEAVAVQVATLRIRTFLGNCSFQLLWRAYSKKLSYKVSLSKTRKASQYQKQTFASALQNGCSEKIEKSQGKYFRRSPVSVMLQAFPWWLY